MIWDADSHIKVFLRVCFYINFPDSVSSGEFKSAVEEFMEQHGLRQTLTYEADMFSLGKTLSVENRLDERGFVDRV